MMIGRHIQLSLSLAHTIPCCAVRQSFVLLTEIKHLSKTW
jgi:hypothetical protein